MNLKESVHSLSPVGKKQWTILLFRDCGIVLNYPVELRTTHAYVAAQRIDGIAGIGDILLNTFNHISHHPAFIRGG